MNSKERVMSAIQGKPVDRLPMGFWYHFPEDSFGSIEETVDLHAKFFEDTPMDIFKIMNENIFPDEFKVTGAQDFRKLRKVQKDDDFIQKQVETTKRIVEKIDGRAFVVMTLHGTIASAWHARGGSDGYSEGSLLLQQFLREDAKAMEEGFKRIAEAMCILVDQVQDSGIDAIYYSALGAESYLFTDAEYWEHVRPYDEMILRHAASRFDNNFLHICKDKLHLERFKDLPAAVINWGEHHENPSLKEGWKHFPDMALLGGFDNSKGPLIDGDKAALKAQVDAVIDAVGEQRLLIGADCTLPGDIRPEQFQKLREVLEAR